MYNRRMETEPLAQELSDQDKVLLVFGYLGPLAIVSLVATRREFVKWHAKQGLVLSAALAALYTVLNFIAFFVTKFMYVWIGRLYWATVWLVVLGVSVMMLVCIVRGLEGERFKIPMLGDLADQL